MRYRSNVIAIAGVDMAYIVITIIVIDRISKMLIMKNMAGLESVPVIEDVFHISYIKNTGMAFGMMGGMNIFLLCLSIAIISGGIFYLYRNRGTIDRYIKIAAALIIGGAIGNIIDRVLYGGVIDFLDFRVINFPVFNFADMMVSFGGAIMVFLLMKNEKGRTAK